MSRSCETLHPMLTLVAEGEANPRELLHVQQHVESCTRCRILLAREHRLSVALDDIADDAQQQSFSVDENFTRSLMEKLERRQRDPRRGLKLAVWFGLILGCLGAGGLASVLRGGLLMAAIPLGTRVMESIPQLSMGWSGLALALLDWLRAPSLSLGAAAGPLLAAVFLAFVLTALFALSGIALAGFSLVRQVRRAA